MSVPRSEWSTTEGRVFSVEWFEPRRNDFGHYTVVYSYRVGEERYSGEFRDYVPEQDTYLRRNDTLEVRYDPEHPERSFYPKARSATKRRLLFAALGAALAAIVMLVMYFTGGFK